MNRENELVNLLTNARKEYYSLNGNSKPILTDAEYDILENELKELNPNNEFFNKVGYNDNDINITKYTHTIPMLSMNKSKNIEDLINWLDRNDELLDKDLNIKTFKDKIVMPKVDGISGDLYYIDGILKGAYTRGDGTTGCEIR